MILGELADLIRANGANTNGRVDAMRNETNAALMNIQNDLTDTRGEIGAIKLDLAEVRRNLDITTVAVMRHEIEALAAEVADLKR